MNEQIFKVIEFSGDGDPMFGGNAADWCLYSTEDGSAAFMSAADAQRRQLVRAYFPTETEAKAAGAAASQRKGLISALPVERVAEIPYAQLRWIVGNMHVGMKDEEVTADITRRASATMAALPDMLAQACAYALASHRANQGLVAYFQL